MPAQEAQDLLQAIDAFSEAYADDEQFAPVIDALGQVAEQVQQLEGGEPSAVDEPPEEAPQPKSYPQAEKAAKSRMRNARPPFPPQ